MNYKIADLNGDSVNDVVIFVGEKTSADDTNVKNADVVFYDGALQKYINADLKKFDGDTARLELADLTGDSLDDIVVILNNEEGDKNIRIVKNDSRFDCHFFILLMLMHFLVVSSISAKMPQSSHSPFASFI